ncbi:unnamed protein product [Cyclocybe aegerita]|uniref:F-box domain-containing protein n=1 Tax=Cyclocybe aegerita TaxID=1973307 RepID=A0A8S0VST2_CYCAE|nr:unnamed protein product [Cyclocybe aegerita]
MAPKKLKKRPVDARPEDTTPTQPVNMSGLPVFPDELLLEILSHYPPLPLSTVEFNNAVVDASVTRREVLQALTQTCSNLRRFFRPYAWQRIEVHHGMVLEITTIRDPSLAEFVNVLNVEVTDYSSEPVLEELARCMALFPNLHTVKLRLLWQENWMNANYLTNAFEKRSQLPAN